MRKPKGRNIFTVLMMLLSLASAATLSLTSIETSEAQVTHVIINEVELNPPSPDLGKEWVELYNPTDAPMDLGRWRIATKSGRLFTVPAGTEIGAKDFLIISFPLPFLDNREERVILRDKDRRVVDQTPLLTDAANDTRTWSRFPNGWDTDADTDWRFQEATRGLSNGKRSTTISIAIFPGTIVVGQSATISGRISVPVTASVTIQVATDTTFTTFAVVTTRADGSYSHTARMDLAGSYRFRATWGGDDFNEGATSVIVSLTVNKIATGMTVFTTAPNVTLGESITVKGAISPAVSGATVTLTYGNPNGTIHTRTAMTFANGSYVDTFMPQTVGDWNVTASWPGDANHLGATSPTVGFVVLAPPRPRPPISAPLTAIVLALAAIATVFAAVAVVVRRPPLGRAGLRPRPLRAARRGYRTKLRPLRVRNGALCPACFRPMLYEPRAAGWLCSHCRTRYPA